MASKICPRCAEKVKAVARVCRHCGHEFPLSLAKPGDEDRTGPRRRRIQAALAIAALPIVVALGYTMAPDIGGGDAKGAVVADAAPATPTPTPSPTASPSYPSLGIGQQIEWTPDQAPAETVRQAGPYVIHITKRVEDDAVAPVVTVSGDGSSATMVGEAVGGTYSHTVSAFQNQPGEPPAIMLQTYTGGAHCCTVVKVAVRTGGVLKVVDMGAWDGDASDPPTDVSGDGVADFVRVDQSFLYAFAPYAMSFSPPSVTNVIGGRAVDASRRPEFAGLYRKAAVDAGDACRNGEDGATRNGACAAYVASVGRSGRAGDLDRAWTEMLAHYDPGEEWQYPKACAVDRAVCPEGMEVEVDGYPSSLLAFLKVRGYVPRAWTPPGEREEPMDAVATDPAGEGER